MWEREGQGWRLAWDSQRDPYPWLIGGDGWASELTAAEGQALGRAVQMASQQHRSLQDTLMEEEAIQLEFTGTVPAFSGRDEGSLWVELEGDRLGWTLRFVLQPGAGQRGLEGFWARGAAEAIAAGFALVAGADPETPT